MGGWKLEAFKMGVYVFFPVGVFWMFNQPTFFEDWVIQKRRELYPPEDPRVKETLKETADFLQRRRQKVLEEEYQRQKSN